jgi:hypothetical protein
VSLTRPPDALLVPRADIEHFVWQQVRHLGRVIVWSYAATELDPHGWAATNMLQVDCHGPTRERAYTMADTARRTIKMLPWKKDTRIVVCSVDCVDGPRWLPDDNAAPRYTARYAIVHHPRQVRTWGGTAEFELRAAGPDPVRPAGSWTPPPRAVAPKPPARGRAHPTIRRKGS